MSARCASRPAWHQLAALPEALRKIRGSPQSNEKPSPGSTTDDAPATLKPFSLPSHLVSDSDRPQPSLRRLVLSCCCSTFVDILCHSRKVSRPAEHRVFAATRSSSSLTNCCSDASRFRTPTKTTGVSSHLLDSRNSTEVASGPPPIVLAFPSSEPKREFAHRQCRHASIASSRHVNCGELSPQTSNDCGLDN
jgi:hypothetical protein